jgi:hypothetical protein
MWEALRIRDQYLLPLYICINKDTGSESVDRSRCFFYPIGRYLSAIGAERFMVSTNAKRAVQVSLPQSKAYIGIVSESAFIGRRSPPPKEERV